MDDIIYYSHYIRIDSESRVIHRFSDAFEQPKPGDICINEQGGYQFRLFPGGEENPPLRDEYGVPLYKWVGATVVKRSSQELEADRPEPIEPPTGGADPMQANLNAFTQGQIDALGGVPNE